MPIRWDEPFGMVMVEAIATDTSVIAFPEGAAGEIVIDGYNGRLVADEAEMADAVEEAIAIDPHDCRESVRSRYDVTITTSGYEAVHRYAVLTRRPSLDPAGPHPLTTPIGSSRATRRARPALLDDGDDSVDVLVGERRLLGQAPVAGAAYDDPVRLELTAQL